MISAALQGLADAQTKAAGAREFFLHLRLNLRPFRCASNSGAIAVAHAGRGGLPSTPHGACPCSSRLQVVERLRHGDFAAPAVGQSWPLAGYQPNRAGEQIDDGAPPGPRCLPRAAAERRRHRHTTASKLIDISQSKFFHRDLIKVATQRKRRRLLINRPPGPNDSAMHRLEGSAATAARLGYIQRSAHSRATPFGACQRGSFPASACAFRSANAIMAIALGQRSASARPMASRASQLLQHSRIDLHVLFVLVY